MNMFNKHLYECFMSVWEKVHQKLEWSSWSSSFFLLTFFMKKPLTKSIVYYQVLRLVWVIYLCTYVAKNACTSGFSDFVLNLSKFGNVLLRKMTDGNCLFSSASLSLVREITHWCMNFQWWSCGAKCKRNICPTSHTEISLWKRPISNSWPVIFLL